MTLKMHRAFTQSLKRNNHEMFHSVCLSYNDDILLEVTYSLLELNIFKSVHANCARDVTRQAFFSKGMCAVESPF
jgi:hypothetical protein